MNNRKLVITIMILAAVSMAGVLAPAPKAFAQADDVTITNVSVYNDIIANGQTLNITVTAENVGSNTETFTVEVFVNGALAAPAQTVVALASGITAQLVFQWDTTTFALGDYTLSAVATLAADENPGNNTFTFGTVTVIFPGDVNGDHIVNLADIAAGALAYGSNPSSANWNPFADMNGDGKVELRDIVLSAINFLKTY
jgi:hypothetical protein